MRRQHIFIAILALIGAACTNSASGPTTTTATSLVVTTTSTTPPTTAVMAPQPAATTIEIWVPGDLVPLVREVAAAFEIDTGIGIDITAIEIDAVLDLLLTDPAAGPNVFVGPHTWLTLLTETGIAEPIAPRSEVVVGALDAVMMRGVVLGAPLALDTIVQFRDTDTLASAPTTIESLAGGCPRGDDTVSCLLLAADSVEGHYPFIAGPGGYVFGPDEFEGWAADDVGIDSATALAGGLILEGIVDGAGILGDGTTTAEERFIGGAAPLLWGSAASLAVLTQGGIDFTVEQLPTIAEAPAPTPIRVTAAWVNAFAPGKEAAVQFVTEYLTAPSSADQIAVTLKMAPVNIGFVADPDLVPFIESARTGDAVPTIFEADYAWEQLATAFRDIRAGGDSIEILGAAARAIRNAPPPEVSGEEEGEG